MHFEAYCKKAVQYRKGCLERQVQRPQLPNFCKDLVDSRCWKVVDAQYSYGYAFNKKESFSCLPFVGSDDPRRGRRRLPCPEVNHFKHLLWFCWLEDLWNQTHILWKKLGTYDLGKKIPARHRIHPWSPQSRSSIGRNVAHIVHGTSLGCTSIPTATIPSPESKIGLRMAWLGEVGTFPPRCLAMFQRVETGVHPFSRWKSGNEK